MEKPNNQSLSPGWAVVASALFIFFWASGFVAAKYGLPYTEPFTFLTLRFLVALIILIPLAYIWRVHWPDNSTSLLHVVISGLLVQMEFNSPKLTLTLTLTLTLS